MKKKDLTTEEIASIACGVLAQVFDTLSGSELAGKTFSFRYTFEEKLNKALKSTTETRICCKCHEEKIVEEFYYRKRDIGGYRDLVCRRCRIKQQSENNRELDKFIAAKNPKIKQTFGARVKAKYMEEEQDALDEMYKDKSRFNAKQYYYDEDKCYLLKKYLKRHEEQLQRCLLHLQKLEEELNSPDRVRRKSNIKSSLIYANAKIRRLEELIANEKELINNPEKRKQQLS